MTLFPYIGYFHENLKPNSFLQSWGQNEAVSGATTESIPPGTVSTPFIWQYFNEEFDIDFYAGFLGVGQDKKTLALKPVIGWAVAEGDKKEEVHGKHC